MSATATSVYQYFDEAGHLLYVGVTGRDVKRGQEHARTKEWWPLVASSTVEHYPSRDEALAVEAYLIRYHQPPYNTAGKSQAKPPKTHVYAVPESYKRAVLGRLSRPTSLADVDLDALAPHGALAAHFIRDAFYQAATAGHSVAEFRNTLRSLLTVDAPAHAA